MSTVLWDVGTLQVLDDATFTKVVNDHVLPRSDLDGSVWAALHDPAVVERTCIALTQLVTRVNAQFSRRNAELEATRQQCWQMGEAGRRAWFEAKARHDSWKAKAAGWKREAEARLLTAKEYRRTARVEQNQQRQPRDDQQARDALRRLALAVHQHQRASQADRIDPEPHDKLLWAVLDEIEVPYGTCRRACTP